MNAARRAAANPPVGEPIGLEFGPGIIVFTRLCRVSNNGLTVYPPPHFRFRPDDRLRIMARKAGSARTARVAQIDTAGIRLEFLS